MSLALSLAIVTCILILLGVTLRTAHALHLELTRSALLRDRLRTLDDQLAALSNRPRDVDRARLERVRSQAGRLPR